MFEIIDEKDKIIKNLTFKEKLEQGNYGENRTDEKIADIIYFFTGNDYARKWYIEKGMYQKMTPYKIYKKFQVNGIDGLFNYDGLIVQIKTRQLGYFLEGDIYFELGRRKKDGKDHFNAWYWKDIDLLLYYYYSLSKKKIMYGYAILLDEFKKIYSTPEKINKNFGIKYDWNFTPTKIYFCPKFEEFPDDLFYDITPIIKDPM